MALNPRGTFSVDLSLFGSRVKDILPTDVPAGISPDEQNNWYLPGMVATRPAYLDVLQNALSGLPSILNVTEFGSGLTAGLPTVFLDSTGSLWINDPSAPTVTSLIGTVTAGLSAKFENAFGKLFAALYSPTLSSQFAKSPFVGAGIPVYYNGQSLNRVTTDAPGITPTFANSPTTPQSIAGFTVSSPLTVTAANAADPYQVQIKPGVFITYYASIRYTCSASVPAAFLGQSVTVSGLTGAGSAFANTTGVVSFVGGTQFKIPYNGTTNFNLTAQSGTVTGGSGSTTVFLQRQSNIVKVWIGGGSLPQNFTPGFWASLLNGNGSVINGPSWTITAISRDATGLVTVTVSTGLTNLPAGAQLYINPGATSFSGTVSVTNGSPAVGLVSGSPFTSDMVGAAITINSVNYQVLGVNSSTSLTLTSNITSATGSYSYSASVQVFPTGFQTVYQVTASSPTSTTFTFQSFDTNVASGSSGSVYQQWSPTFGTNTNAAQILTSGVDPNNGAFYTFFQLGPDTSLGNGQGNISSPVAQIQGQIQPGIRNAVLIFQSQDGALTAPSQIVQVSVTGGTNLLVASGIPIGPAGTAQRVLAFTPYLGSSWFFLEPATILNFTGQGQQIVSGTVIPDNVSTSATIDFSDAQLTAGTQIDAAGNDLFNQFVLPPCLGVMEYSSRLHWWGAINNVRNLLNMGLDGGYTPPAGTVTVTNGSPTVTWATGNTFTVGPNGATANWAGAQIIINGTSYTILSVQSTTSLTLTANFVGTNGTYTFTALAAGSFSSPLGWTPNLAAGIPTAMVGPSLAAPNGFSAQLQGNGSATASITQGAYQDEFGGPICLPSTQYTIRFLAQAAAGGKSLSFNLFSPSTGFSSTCSVLITSVGSTPGPITAKWYTAIFSNPTPASIPTDLQFNVVGPPLDSTILWVDEIELILTNQPVESGTVHSSYVDDPFGYDAVTGLLQPDTTFSVSAMFKQRGNAYILTDGGLFQSQDNGQTEPDGWKITEYATNCGCSGPNAVDSTEDIAWWSGRYGARIFNGNPTVKKISQEVAADWETINWASQTLLWVRNDPVQRVVYFGIVQAGNISPNAMLAMNYRLNDDAYNIPDPVHTSQYSGKMIATDLGRKWSFWTPGMNHAAMCTRPSTTSGLARQIVFAGAGHGNLYTQDVVNHPTNPAYTAWNCVDADFGAYPSYYVTYAFYDHMTEQNPLLGLYRKFFDFVGAHLIGIGKMNITPFVDALSQAWPQFPAFNMQPVDPGFDYQLPWNVRGDRMFLKFAPSPFAGQTGSAYALTHLIVSGRQDMSFPVRGSIL